MYCRWVLVLQEKLRQYHEWKNCSVNVIEEIGYTIELELLIESILT